MRFEVTYDDAGEPSGVHTDNGYIMEFRKFRPEQDGWMLDQLNPRDFTAIRIGDDTARLVAEVNALRRKNFQLEGEVEQWRKASGF